MSRVIRKLEEAWKFAIDPNNIGIEEEWFRKGLPAWKEIKLPHTFNIEPETVAYRGSAWYAYPFFPEKEWLGKRVRLQFNGVYRDADIWLNGEFLGQHYNSGFTAFTVDMEDKFRIGVENNLVVRVQNHYSSTALPYGNSFDWADDGGIYRDVSLIITGKAAIDHVKLIAKPVISSYGNRITHTKATLEAKTVLIPAAAYKDKSCCIEVYKGSEKDMELLYRSADIAVTDANGVDIPEIHFEQVELWHFDNPQLYTAVITLKQEEVITDRVSIRFGFREFITEGHRFILNGEYVRLCGTEWMPGANPEYGNAEPIEYIVKTLEQLKESNCVFTRFHWQQDEAVYDWCNRNGMLIQEEIPYWGKAPELPERQQMLTAREQINEMLVSHYNHPSIIMWGMGNELAGQSKELQDFIGELKDYIKQYDSIRPVNYITNTIFENPANDATSLGDVLMVNEYLGTWHGNLDEIEELNKIIKSNPNRSIVISEFGLCEPAFPGGDKRRCELFQKKMSIYEKFPEISGIINFCLNDYRTQMGEQGQYQFRRRVHGSVDIFGEPKPSYYIVQEVCSPVAIRKYHDETGDTVISLSVKDTLPSYRIEGYEIIFKKTGKLLERIKIPSLKPGGTWEIKVPAQSNSLRIVRPNGFLVIEKNT